MIRIRSGSQTKGVSSYDLNMIKPTMIKMFNDSDSNTISKPDQKGLSYDSNMIQPPNDLSVYGYGSNTTSKPAKRG